MDTKISRDPTVGEVREKLKAIKKHIKKSGDAEFLVGILDLIITAFNRVEEDVLDYDKREWNIQ